MNLAFNLSSDLLILSIPIPLFIKTRLPWKQKLLLVFPFSLGIFVILCAILSKHLSFTQPFSAEWVYWYSREASTAVIVANMPYTWPLLRRFFRLPSFTSESAEGQRDSAGLPLPGGTLGTSQHPLFQSFAGSLSAGPEDEKKSGANGTLGGQDMTVNRWHDGERDKAVQIVSKSAGPESISSEGSRSREAGVSSTSAALDKMYPLDEDEF